MYMPICLFPTFLTVNHIRDIDDTLCVWDIGARGQDGNLFLFSPTDSLNHIDPGLLWRRINMNPRLASHHESSNYFYEKR